MVVVVTFTIKKKKLKLLYTHQKDHEKLSLALSPLKHYNIIEKVPLVSYTKKQGLMGCLDAQKFTQLRHSQFY